MNKTNKKEIAMSIADISMSNVKFIYGDKQHQHIVARMVEMNIVLMNSLLIW